jgi:hypothetical protein
LGSPEREAKAFDNRRVVFGRIWLAMGAVLMMIWLYGVTYRGRDALVESHAVLVR